jgi:hypothetical protein
MSEGRLNNGVRRWFPREVAPTYPAAVLGQRLGEPLTVASRQGRSPRCARSLPTAMGVAAPSASTRGGRRYVVIPAA